MTTTTTTITNTNKRKRELNNGPRIHKEKETVTKMIEVYCRKNHHCHGLCEECQDLNDYAMKRLSFCQFGEEKLFCSYCPVHCYKSDYREKIKVVMRFSGPWMLVYHPVLAVRHIWQEKVTHRDKH